MPADPTFHQKMRVILGLEKVAGDENQTLRFLLGKFRDHRSTLERLTAMILVLERQNDALAGIVVDACELVNDTLIKIGGEDDPEWGKLQEDLDRLRKLGRSHQRTKRGRPNDVGGVDLLGRNGSRRPGLGRRVESEEDHS